MNNMLQTREDSLATPVLDNYIPAKESASGSMLQSINAIMTAADEKIKGLSYILGKKYCDDLSILTVKEITPLSLDQIAENVWLYRVTSLSYNSMDENIVQKIETIISAVNMCGGTFMMIVESGVDKDTLTFGVSTNNSSADIEVLKNILYGGLTGSFPGIQIEDIGKDIECTKKNIEERFCDGYTNQCVTAISSIVHPQNNTTIPSLHTILNSTEHEIYTIFMLAEPVDKTAVARTRDNYESISTQLSQLLNLSIGRQISNTVSTDWHVSDGISHGTQYGTSHTDGTSDNEDTSETRDKDFGDYLCQTAAAFSALSGNLAVAYGLKMANEMGHMDDAKLKKSSKGTTSQDSQNESINDATNHQDSHGGSESFNQGDSMQYSIVNRSAKRVYDEIEKYLQWLDDSKMLGMMNVSTYILSPSQAQNITVASRYNALLGGNGGQLYGVNSWSDESAREVCRYLQEGKHPEFVHPQYGIVTPAIMMSSKELAWQLALPSEKVSGIMVESHAPFGRKVVTKSGTAESTKIKLGNISYLGAVQENAFVQLSTDDLVSHCLVSGQAGIGKTTAVCSMLTRLSEKDIPFMVIEPAKGEYKHVLSGIKNIKIFSPMPEEQHSDALKLNLFWFREGVDPREHIEKLEEIFCASWPMYAAMPQVLHAALCNAYIKCGWNLRTNRNYYGRIFPTLTDLCNEIRNIINNETDFSADLKGNYVSSLLTRIEDLGRGITGAVFSGENLDDDVIFENNVVIDLSRPDSSELQSLIMGTLIMRLFEYCTSSQRIMENRHLTHITVLEEAHNLLGNFKAAAEGNNMREKSVEMLTRCITELGGFGQGFIISDQSPSALNENVIKNTNTKIIFNLPFSSDYNCCGKAIGLLTEQIDEIPQLGRGVCVVNQNSWVEPVQCHVEKYLPESHPVYYNEFDRKAGMREFFACLLKPYSVVGPVKPSVTEYEIQCATEWAKGANYSITDRKCFLHALESPMKFKDCVPIVETIIGKKTKQNLFEFAGSRDNIEQWTSNMLAAIQDEFTDDYLIAMTIIEVLLYDDTTGFKVNWFDSTNDKRKNVI